MSELLGREFLFVIGKGGVGKTTTSAALALAAARRGKRVLIALCNTKERLSRVLDSAPIGPHIRPLMPNIDAVNIEPEVALEEYGLMILKVRALYHTIFENRFVAAFLRGTPGIEAWAMLGKAYFHATERDAAGRKRYDLVILDAPATGHGLDMLRVPEVIVDVAPPGLLRKDAEAALALFRDEKRSGVVIVTLPEDMPTRETLELYKAVTGELRMPVARLVINSVLPRVFDPHERTMFETLPQRLGTGSPIESLACAGRTRALREGMQEESIGRLVAGVPVPRTELPHLFTNEFRRDSVEALSHAF